MPTLFVFLFKVNIALLLFCAGYYLVLRHLTFYTLNRVYLVTAIIFATLYPKIDLTAFAQRHETIARPVQNVALVWQAPAEKLATHTDYWKWAAYVFWAGAALLAMRLAMQLFSLFKLYRRSKPAQIYNHDVRLMEGDAAPFSFWQSIYINPNNHTPADLEAILLHEQVHVNGWHTIDILLAELSSIFYWFNPGIWLMKKAVRENIEFITDRKILNKGFDSKTYQYSLVNVSFNNSTPGIVNHFNISTIKKRIIMMNAKRSSRVNLTRYVFVIPAVVALLLVFTLSKAEVAKPLTLKITNAMQPVTLAIKEATVTAINNTKTAIKETKAAAIQLTGKDTTLKSTFTFATTTNAKPATVKSDSLVFAYTTGKADTGKKTTLYIGTSNRNSGLDSMNLILNGKKISSREFKNIDPDKISAVNIVAANAVAGLIGPDHGFDLDNGRQVMFITTSDSEAGKKLANRLGRRNQITNVRINGVNKAPGLLTTSELAIVSALPGLTTTANGQQIAALNITKGVKVSGISAYKEPLTEVVVAGYPAKLKLNDVLVVKGLKTDPKLKLNEVRVKAYKTDPDLKEVVITGYPTDKLHTTDSAVTVTGYGNGKLNTINGTVLRLHNEPTGVVSVRTTKPNGTILRFNNVATVDMIDRETGDVVTPVNMADKLYIIDGKEASEKAMKKLSAFDIDRINVSKNTNVVDKYGDKAKNGVIFIYTKKNKK
ncbi:M56 family metallopeptidase [Mucilaginibacter glaciei]|uniref:M56 family metallopeptidase n=1 Tax=Mucilaginibacter glaciei TaxID=2772109 RepID=A0A926NM68_9SPHI|nr:M56 family metallopeptidase [Mucilaginibacter glaciei]MBD1391773.1 M56 family metallopeptidase [Mucilaginibacter glaciei]